MRLGGPVFGDISSPEKWVDSLRASGYRAAYWPLKNEASRETRRAFAEAARAADIVIAEVGAWSNPISPDGEVRQKAIRYCQERLALAEEVGACCCVNIAGSRAERWDGPHPDNLSPVTFDLVVETTQGIIDSVQPERTFYTLEMMPWSFPDSVDSYIELMDAIDRPQFAVHLDPVNIISSPQRYFSNTALIEECFAKLGPDIKSCHAKDIWLDDRLTVHLDEVRPGLGHLDYRTLLREMDRLPADTPLMLEHLPQEEDYRLAAAYVRQVADEIGIAV